MIFMRPGGRDVLHSISKRIAALNERTVEACFVFAQSKSVNYITNSKDCVTLVKANSQTFKTRY